MWFPRLPRFTVLLSTIALALAATGVGMVVSPWPPAVAEALKARVPLLERTRGKLERIDARARSLTLATAETTVDVHLDEATTIFVDGRPNDLGALHVGQDVCATWEPGSAIPTAQWVEPCDEEER